MEIGASLREIRETRGLTLRDIARTTKLSVTMLRCIERDQLERLPGGILTRGCLRSYAAAIGGGAGPLVEDFLAQNPLTIDAPALPEPPIELQPAYRRTATLVVVGIGLAAYLLWHLAVPHRQAAPLETTAVIEDPLDVVPAAATVPVSNALEPELRLAVTAIGPCWISVSTDDDVEVPQLLQAGDRLAVGARQTLLIRVGDPSMFTYRINGRRGRVLGEAARPVTVRITAANYESFLAVPGEGSS